MKAKVLIAAFLVAFAATPVLAQGNGNGNGNGNGGQTDNGNNGNGNGNNNQTDTPAGNAENGGNGHGNNNSGGAPGTGADGKPSAEPTIIPEADLLSLVEAGQAVSLSSLLPSVQERTGGQIIDAQLVRTERSLIYVLKVLTPEGRVGVEYYNARSGIHIEVR